MENKEMNKLNKAKKIREKIEYLNLHIQDYNNFNYDLARIKAAQKELEKAISMFSFNQRQTEKFYKLIRKNQKKLYLLEQKENEIEKLKVEKILRIEKKKV